MSSSNKTKWTFLIKKKAALRQNTTFDSNLFVSLPSDVEPEINFRPRLIGVCWFDCVIPSYTYHVAQCTNKQKDQWRSLALVSLVDWGPYKEPSLPRFRSNAITADTRQSTGRVRSFGWVHRAPRGTTPSDSYRPSSASATITSRASAQS